MTIEPISVYATILTSRSIAPIMITNVGFLACIFLYIPGTYVNWCIYTYLSHCVSSMNINWYIELIQMKVDQGSQNHHYRALILTNLDHCDCE